jgi:adenylate kinase
LEHRSDDQEETVTKRLDAYEAQTSALLPYYEQQGLLKTVDGSKSPDEVTQQIRGALATR